MKVMKFGGTSVGKPERMHDVATLITRDTEEKIVVLSALSGTTNSLVEIGTAMANGDRAAAKQVIDKLDAHYQTFISNLLSTEAAQTFTKIVDSTAAQSAIFTSCLKFISNTPYLT